jgi:hypothetical protein
MLGTDNGGAVIKVEGLRRHASWIDGIKCLRQAGWALTNRLGGSLEPATERHLM